MTDIVTYCDINTCEDCPRYGDDCDGDKYLDRYPTMHEYSEGKRINPKLTDQISRADAIEAVASITMSIHLSDVICDKLLALPSADAVSREECDECKTDKEGVLLQQLAELQGDYETMKNAYEDALADAEWIPCSERMPSDDEYVIVSVLDDHGDTPWKYTTVAWLCNGAWISDNEILCGTAVAWMPLPLPYREDGEI